MTPKGGLVGMDVFLKLRRLFYIVVKNLNKYF